MSAQTPAQPAGSTPSSGSWRSQFALIICTFAGANLGYTALLPFLPELSADLGLDATMLTVFLLVHPLAKICCQPAGGALTDRLGAKEVLLGGTIVGIVGLVLTATAVGPVTGILGRIIWGTGIGAVVPAMYRATSLLAERYGVPDVKLLGRLVAFAVLTTAFGPVAAGTAHAVFGMGYREVLLVAGALSGVGALGAARGLNRLEGTRSGPAVAQRSQLAGTVRSSLRPVYVFGICSMWAMLLFLAIEPLVPLYAAEQSDNPVGYGSLVLAVCLFSFVATKFSLARAPSWVLSPAAGVACLAVLGVTYAVLYLVTVPVIGIPAIAVLGVACAQLFAMVREGITRSTDKSGRVWARFGVLTDLGALLAPVLALQLFDRTGPGAFPILGAATIVVAAVFTAVFGAGLHRPRAAVPVARDGAGVRLTSPDRDPAS